jgi:hypothetical protein
MHSDVKPEKPVLFVRIKPVLNDWVTKEALRRDMKKSTLLEEILLCAKKGVQYVKLSHRELSDVELLSKEDLKNKKIASKKR